MAIFQVAMKIDPRHHGSFSALVDRGERAVLFGITLN
jgi:hypothetical protein